METTNTLEDSLLTTDCVSGSSTHQLCEFKSEIKLEPSEHFEEEEYKYFMEKIPKAEVKEETSHNWETEETEFIIKEEETDTDDAIAPDQMFEEEDPEETDTDDAIAPDQMFEVEDPVPNSVVKEESSQKWDEVEIEYTFKEEEMEDPLALDEMPATEEMNQQDSAKAASTSENSFTFDCVGCGMTYTTTDSLERHHKICPRLKDPAVIMKHKNLSCSRDIECDVCEKTFTHSGHLNEHRIIHSEQRPFKCNVCDKTFTQASNLNKHRLIHTGERPFKFVVCEKTFTQASDLNKHRPNNNKMKQLELCQ